MSSMKSFTNTFMLAIATLAITACVPKATEKKAVCGKNEAFSTVSRSCYSIEELRAKPVGATSTATVSEETPKTITLAYTDANKDQALSCKITVIPSGLEMITPSALDGGLNDKADEVYLAVSNLAAELALSEAAMRAALLKAKASVYFPTTEAQFGIFKTAANFIITAGAGSLNPNAQFYYTLAQQRMLVLNQKLTDLANRCECSAGVCATVVIPKLNKTAATGFSYTVTDVDGESNAKAVAVTVNAMSALTAHLAPAARSSNVSLLESDTSDPINYDTEIVIPTAADLTPAGSVVPLRYFFNGPKNGANQGVTSKGIVINCMDLVNVGAVDTTDTSCTYIPNPDAFDTITTDLNASVVVDDLTYTAVAKGTAGNSFSVQYYSLKDDNLAIDPMATEIEKFGLVSNASEAFIRVVGNSIKVFIHPGVTSSAGIASLITAHPQASKMVTVSAGSAVNFPEPSLVTPSAVFLAGGTAGFDKIPFYAKNNAGAVSTNAAAVHIRMASVDDYPILAGLPFVPASSVNEDVTPILINLKTGNAYSDVDTDLVGPFNYTNVCEVTTIDTQYPGTNFTAYSCSCVLDVCTANLTPTANASSALNASLQLIPFTFQYRIGSVDAATPAVTRWTNYKDYKLTINPINDAPILTLGVIPAILEGGSGFMDVDIAPGGSGYESTQTLTLTAESDNLTIFPVGSIVVGELPVPVAGRKRVTFTPAANQSGLLTNITLTLKDSGGTALTGVDTTTATFVQPVTFVDNPPTFISTITKIETNEGGAVQSDAFQVDEDLGSSPDEDSQTIRIVSIVSDNPSVLPNSAIKVFYDLNNNGVQDSGEQRCVPATVAPACTDILEGTPVVWGDVKTRNFYLKLDPVDGISGNANIILTISDGTTTASTTFSFIVHPIAALHGGWKNISSVGIKTDKLDAPVSAAEIVCNYNRKDTTTPANSDSYICNGADCTGSISPNGSIIPDAKNVIFWDASAKRCYRAEQALDKFSWVDFNTSCPVTRTKVAAPGVCSGNNCIHDNSISATYPKGTLIPSAPGQYHYNTSNKTCYVSTDINNDTDWQEYVPSKVTLAWKPFIMVGSGAESNANISGWNIYRREKGTDYNFKGGHLKVATSNAVYTITDPSVMTFTDTTAIAGKVYYYVVRPVSYSRYNNADRTFPTYTPEVFSEVRVLASPANYSFVHRWIVNQEVCNGMNITTTTTLSKVDSAKNFRCEYYGPGQTQDPSDLKMYYDYGRDLLVDSQEVGCPYAVAPNCTANGCVGIGVPSYSGLAANSLYYDRGAGKCYRYPGAGTVWTELENFAFGAGSEALSDRLRSALNAPLVNVTQAKAVSICANRPAPTGTQIATFVPAYRASLPNKKDYNGYASQKLDVLDPDIEEMELGYSLNIQSRCNASSASGLETAYTNAHIPSTSFIYSLPGSFSSNIRSLYTGSIPWAGSKSTEACISRFGIQDLYGNVAEWTQDQISCDVPQGSANECTAITDDINPASSFSLSDFAGDAYAFNTKSGPYNDVNGSNTVDSGDGVMGQWAFEDQFFGASKFSYPLALPISSAVAYPSEPLIDFILDIGPSSGIPNNKLHKDGVIFNNATLASKTASFAVGGSYLSGNLAGRYTSELIESTLVRPDVGFRCILPINSNTGYPADPQHTYQY